jgi:hypothetical protein
MNTDDILGCLRDHFPGQMVPIDAMLFRAGYTRMGLVVPGCEGQVRALLIDRIPNSINYFKNNAKMPSTDHTHPADACTARLRRV